VLGAGCMVRFDPLSPKTNSTSTVGQSGDRNTSSTPTNTGGLQVATTNAAGDPWPFRLAAGGLAVMGGSLTYAIRRLGLSRPDNGR
jgi:hypothetical protein